LRGKREGERDVSPVLTIDAKKGRNCRKKLPRREKKKHNGV